MTLFPSGGSNNASAESIGTAALIRYVIQLGGPDPEYSSWVAAWGDGAAVHPDVADGGLPISGTSFSTALEIGNAATTISLAFDPAVGTNHLPSSGTVTLLKGPFASVTATATNGVAVDEVVITSRAGNILTITGKDATPYPPGSRVILRDANNKQPNPPEIDKYAFADFVFSAMSSLEAHVLVPVA